MCRFVIGIVFQASSCFVWCTVPVFTISPFASTAGVSALLVRERRPVVEEYKERIFFLGELKKDGVSRQRTRVLS